MRRNSISFISLLLLFSLLTGAVEKAFAEGPNQKQNPQESTATFIKHTIDGSFENASSAYPVDMDGDGDMDVLGVGSEIAWWENNGSEGFNKHYIDDLYGGFPHVYPADLDNDGDIDVLGSSWGMGKIAWWENDGEEAFIKHIISSDVSSPNQLFAVDLDGDYDMDILIRGDDIDWWENDGNENFSRHTLGSFYFKPVERPLQGPAPDLCFDYSLTANDIDSDGDMDVVGTTPCTLETAWWENDGRGGFSKHTISDLGGMAVHTTDVDSDRDIDVLEIAWGTHDSYELIWWENDGSENFSKHTIDTTFFGVIGPDQIYGTDVDGDGDIDVLGAEAGAVWWENDGSENFTKHTIEGGSIWPESVFPTDLDDDGDVDVLGADRNAGAIVWWEQVSDLPFPPLAYIKDGDIWIIQVGDAQGQPITSSGSYSEIHWSPNGLYILARNDAGHLHVVDVKTGDVVELSGPCAPHMQVDISNNWAPDGYHLLVQGSGGCSNENSARMVNVEGEVKYEFPHGIWFPVWGENGEELFYTDSPSEGLSGFWKVRLEDSTYELIYRSEPDDLPGYYWVMSVYPAETSDWIAAVSNNFEGTGYLVFLSKQGGFHPYPFDELNSSLLNPGLVFGGAKGDWSSDGSRFVFPVSLVPMGDNVSIVIYDVIRGEREVLLESGGLNPRWSPTGEQISITTPKGGLQVVDSITKDSKQLLLNAPKSALFDYDPGYLHEYYASVDMESRWSNNGDFILFNYPYGSPIGFYIVDVNSEETVWIDGGISPEWRPIFDDASYLDLSDVSKLVEEKKAAIDSLRKREHKFLLILPSVDIDIFKEENAILLIQEIEDGRELSSEEILAFERLVLAESKLVTLTTHQMEVIDYVADTYIDAFSLLSGFGSLVFEGGGAINVRAHFADINQSGLEVLIRFQDELDIPGISQELANPWLVALGLEYPLTDSELVDLSDGIIDLGELSHINTETDLTEFTVALTELVLGKAVRAYYYKIFLDKYVQNVEPTLDWGVRSVLHEEPYYQLNGTYQLAEDKLDMNISQAESVKDSSISLIEDVNQGRSINSLAMETGDLAISVTSLNPITIAVMLATRMNEAWLNVLAQRMSLRAYACITRLSVGATQLAFQSEIPIRTCPEYSDLDALPPFLEHIIELPLWEQITSGMSDLEASSLNLLHAIENGDRQEIESANIDIRTIHDMLAPRIHATQMVLLSPPSEVQAYSYIAPKTLKLSEPTIAHISTITNSIPDVANASSETDYSEVAYRLIDQLVIDLYTLEANIIITEMIAEAALTDEPYEPLVTLLDERIMKISESNIALTESLERIPSSGQTIGISLLTIINPPDLIEALPHENIDLQFDVSNYGNAASGNLSLKVELNGEELTSKKLGVVHPGDIAETSLSISAPEPGMYWLYLTLHDGERSDLSIVPLFIGGENTAGDDAVMSDRASFFGGVILLSGSVLLLIGIGGFFVIRRKAQ